MFTKAKNMDSAFRYVRMFTLVIIICCVALCAFIQYRSSLLFWTLGGGKGTQAQAKNQKGFNMELPAPVLKNDSEWNKLSFYRQAEADSARIRKLMKADPYYSLPLTTVDTTNKKISELNAKYLPPARHSSYSSTPDEQEAKVYEKLATIDEQLNRIDNGSSSNKKAATGADNDISVSRDVEKLDQLMKEMQQPGEPDPGLTQLKEMMETLKEIQHPELVNQKIKEQSAKERGKVFMVTPASIDVPVSVLLPRYRIDTLREFQYASGFYGLETGSPAPQDQNTAVAAIIAETQILTSGATVKMRLSEPVFINGLEISAGQFVYGTAQLSGERLKINISSIRYENHILPVSLSVYDLDGQEGIFIPGAITRDVAKQSVDQPLQSMGMLSLDPSIGAQAATAGIETAKKMISRKVKQIRVTVKTGYEVLLRDTQSNQ